MRPPESVTSRPPARPNAPEKPPIPPEEMIRRFAAKEDEMVGAIIGYSFQQSVRVEEIGPDNKPSGQMEIVTQQFTGPDGKRYQKMIHRSASTLHYLDLERGDREITVTTPLFPLTTSQLPKYVITFEGKQPLDELSAYIFAVKPRSVDRAHAYFSGTVWVDDQDFVIVKSIGKWVTETGDVTAPGLPFAVFETYRQEVGKGLWFPAYSRSDEFFSRGDTTVPIRMVIRWSDFTPGGAPAAGPPASANPSDSKNRP